MLESIKSRDAKNISGTNATTGDSGDFPVDCIWVLPTLVKPSPEIVGLFKLSRSELENLASRAPQNQFNLNENVDTIFTLEEFAMEYFNTSVEDIQSSFFSFKSKTRELVWSKGQDPIRQPLLKSVEYDLHERAVQDLMTNFQFLTTSDMRDKFHPM